MKAREVSSYVLPRVQTWNTSLFDESRKFREKHSDVKVKIYDAWAVFTRVLDEPWSYGFEAVERKDVRWGGDSIWHDHLHPTSAMYQVLADDLYKTLTEQEGPERVNGVV
jgi:phospholipase/lecithinase/hemolysin